MKKLEDFQAQKVELKNICGGSLEIGAGVSGDEMTVVVKDKKVTDVKADGPDPMS